LKGRFIPGIKNRFIWVLFGVLGIITPCIPAQNECDDTRIWRKWEFHEGLPMPFDFSVRFSAYTSAHYSEIVYHKKRSESLLNGIAPETDKGHPVNWMGAFSGWDPLFTDKYGRAGFFALPYIIGRMYGLVIDEFIDERFDLEKAAGAAFFYTNHLQTITGSAAMTFMAYSSSLAALEAVKFESKSPEVADWVPLFSSEVRGRLTQFVQAVGNYLCAVQRFDTSVSSTANADGITTFTVTDTLHMGRVAAYLGMDSIKLKMLNPVYRGWLIPGNSNYRIRLPSEKVGLWESIPDSIRQWKASVPVIQQQERPNAATETWKWIKVRSGETLTAIAARYSGVSVQDIMNWNGLRTDKIYIGQSLKLKVRE